MQDTLELDIVETTNGSASVFTIDTEYSLKSCRITSKNEAKIVTESGITQMTKPLVNGNFIAISVQKTRFSFYVIFIPADVYEFIQIPRQ